MSVSKGISASLLRSLPQVHQALESEEMRAATSRHGRGLVAVLLRDRLDWIRKEARARRLGREEVAGHVATLGAWIEERCREMTASTLRPAINATGVVLHTNLGRAILPDHAVRRMTEVARAYTTLEYDLEQ